MTHPWFAAGTRPRVLAHRGLVTPDAAADGVVDNSLLAFAAAEAAGATYIETDCRLTRDGEVVLLHDADLARLAGDDRPVDAVTLDEIAAAMESRGGVVTLAQALETFPGVRWNVDVKSADAADAAGRVVASYADRVLMTSFSDTRRRVAIAAALAAGGRPAASAGTTTTAAAVLASALGLTGVVGRVLPDVDALQIPLRVRGVPVVTRRLVRAAHRAGVEVHVWTVNDMDLVRRLFRAGIDGVVTDRVDLALDVAAHVGDAPEHPL